MFQRVIYQQRRHSLVRRIGSGLILLPGNGYSPMNYRDNAYPFRQDSTFLYYIGLDHADLFAIIDADSGETTLYGDEPTIDDIVWMGDVPGIAERAERAGIARVRPRGALAEAVGSARGAGRPVHFLAPYRGETTLLLASLLGVSDAGAVEGMASAELIRAVVAQRSYKSAEEVAGIERAVAVSVTMHETAMRMARPGVTERTIMAELTRIALDSGGRLAYPVIGTVRGETLHNHGYGNTLDDGALYLLDAGAETAMGYAADLTSTCPVSDSFDARQRDVWSIVLAACDAAVAAAAPGVNNRDVHFAAARVIFDGMKQLGLMRGDTDDAIAAGAHALVFPHGIGHMLGLDVHDMENLGEHYVGYDEQPRSTRFGLKSLRLARPLEPGFAITIEPGIYFIPQLIDRWRSERQHDAFIDYDAFDAWRGFGGMRNEENWLITADGARRLGPRKPQTIEEIEAVRDVAVAAR